MFSFESLTKNKIFEDYMGLTNILNLVDIENEIKNDM